MQTSLRNHTVVRSESWSNARSRNAARSQKRVDRGYNSLIVRVRLCVHFFR